MEMGWMKKEGKKKIGFQEFSSRRNKLPKWSLKEIWTVRQVSVDVSPFEKGSSIEQETSIYLRIEISFCALRIRHTQASKQPRTASNSLAFSHSQSVGEKR